MFKTIFKMLYPSKCIFCGVNINDDQKIDICEECYNLLKFTDNSNYIPKNMYYDMLYSAVEYEGVIVKYIKKFKYQNKAYLFRTFTKLILNRINGENINADIIVSVPLHKDREINRGYNQSELLAKEISKLMKIEYNANVLKRSKITNHLAKCNKKERQRMINGVFTVENKESILDKTVIIVDDVFTTGATINECSKVLKKNGAKKIIAITIAKVVI